MEHLELVLNWFSSLGISPNLDKLKRQLSIITTWFARNCVGVVSAVTGFGKTYIAIIAIYRLNLKYPEATTIVIVPTTKLFNDWEEHISQFDLKNVTVYVVNTYTATYLNTKVKHKCTLLVCDEVHNYLSENGKQFNQTITGTEYNMFLGLSATISEKEEAILETLHIPIIDTVSMSEAKRSKFISNYKTYNFGITLPSIELEKYTRMNDIHNSNYAKFYYFVDRDKNWDLAVACGAGNDKICKVGQDYKTAKEWKQWYAETMGWDGDKEHIWSPQNIGKYANQWSWAMRERKDFLYKHSQKIEVTKAIIERLNIPTIVFSENTGFADTLQQAIGSKAMVYHSKVKASFISKDKVDFRKTLHGAKTLKQRYDGIITPTEGGYNITYKKEKKISGVSLNRLAITKFQSGEIIALITAKALDEGYNVEGIECAITCAGSSKQRQGIQRNGRALRFREDKTAILINIYIKGTQDEVWLKRRQKGESGIIYVDQIEQII